ncbi:polysaccharide deacetylase family protein [Ferruginibacter sp.]|nr:polysaccharide deacetylase family protein [Ferruginibacter sp.]
MKNCFSVFCILLLLSCNAKKDSAKQTITGNLTANKDTAQKAAVPVADATTILSKKQVPVLCYHHINNSKPGDYVVPPSLFATQLQALADSGYQTILPDQLYNYLTTGTPLPVKAFMLTFDDTDEEQYTIGATEMAKHNFKGVFFIMNISIGRPRYMSKEQIKQLADEGHIIAAHTWDHHRVTEYTTADWDKQLTEAKQKLETITGKPVTYFAYPFGLWKPPAIPELQQRNIKMAFQLSTKPDTTQPLYTVRRMLVPGTWTNDGLFKAMKRTFHL